MAEFSFKMEVNAPSETIWKMYENANIWPHWDSNLEFAKLNGDFKEGTTGLLKLKEQPPISFHLSSVIPNKQFFNKATIPGTETVLCFGHTLIKVEGKTLVKHSVSLGKADGKITEKDISFLAHVFRDIPQNILDLKKIVEVK